MSDLVSSHYHSRPDAAAQPAKRAGADRAADVRAPIAVVAAVEFELRPLERLLAGAEPLRVGRKAAMCGTLEGSPVILLPGGMGKTNAAHALTALLERHAVRGVLNIGVGGAYPGSGLAVGALALASAEIYGDEGVDAPRGWLSTQAIGIPLLQAENTSYFNEFPLDPVRVAAARQALDADGFAVGVGPFVTLSCCSGTTRRGREFEARFGAICESMEGAALAHLCTLYATPFLELRGISNAVEDRDLSRWRLGEAVDAATRAALTLLRHWA